MVEIETASIVFTGLSISLAAFYYIRTLQNAQRTQQQQLETRQAQLFMGIYQYLYSPEYSEHEYTLAHKEIKDFDDFVKACNDLKMWKAMGAYHAYFEGIGILVKEGLVDIRLVAQLMSGAVIWFWERYRSVVVDYRRENAWPRFMIEVEYLYNALNEYAASHPELQIASPKRDRWITSEK